MENNSTGHSLLYIWLRVLFKFIFSLGTNNTNEIVSTLIDVLTEDLTLQLDQKTSIILSPYIPIEDFHVGEKCNGRQNVKCRRMVTSNNCNLSVVFKTKLLNRCSYCTYIILNKDYYTLHTDGTTRPPIVVVEIDFHGVIANISDYGDFAMMTMSSEGLYICTELLDKKVELMKHFKQYSTVSTTFQNVKVFTMKSVMILSGACLSLTLVTYAMFPELRSEAGKNNIMLCVSLLLATVTVMAKSYM